MTRIPSNISGPVGLSPAVVVPNIGASTQDVVNTTLANRASSNSILSTYLQTSAAERMGSKQIAAQMWEAELRDTAARDDLADRLDYNRYISDLNYGQNQRILGEGEFQFDATREDKMSQWNELTTQMNREGMLNWSKVLMGQLAELQGVERMEQEGRDTKALDLQILQTYEQRNATEKREAQMLSQQLAAMTQLVTIGEPGDVLRMLQSNPLFKEFSSPDEMLEKIKAGKLSPLQLRIAGQVAAEGATALMKRMREELGPEYTVQLRRGWDELIKSGNYELEDFSALSSQDLVDITSLLMKSLPDYRALLPGEKQEFVNNLIRWGPGFDALTQMSQVSSSVMQLPVSGEDPQIVSILQEARGALTGTSAGKLAERMVTEAKNPDGTYNTETMKGILIQQLKMIFDPDGPLNDYPLAPLFTEEVSYQD